MALLDMAGLDIYAAVGGYLNKELSNRSDVAAYIGERTAQRKLGIKTGSGIYDYTPEKIAELQSAAGAQAGGGAQGVAGMTRRIRTCAVRTALLGRRRLGARRRRRARRPPSSRRSPS